MRTLSTLQFAHDTRRKYRRANHSYSWINFSYCHMTWKSLGCTFSPGIQPTIILWSKDHKTKRWQQHLLSMSRKSTNWAFWLGFEYTNLPHQWMALNWSYQLGIVFRPFEITENVFYWRETSIINFYYVLQVCTPLFLRAISGLRPIWQ